MNRLRSDYIKRTLSIEDGNLADRSTDRKVESLTTCRQVTIKAVTKGGNRMKENYCLYMHTTPSGKVYIGITCREPLKRWKNGKGYSGSPHFDNAIKKYGWDNIKHEVLLTGLTKKSACEMEKCFIQMYDSTNPAKGYNSTFGGDEGLKITKETRKKISEANKIVYSDPKRRHEMSKRMIGYKHSEEAKKKMSESHKGLTHVASDEWKKNISHSLKEYYADPINSEKYRRNSERLTELGKRKARKVEQLDFQMNVVNVYESLNEAGRQTGVRDGNISKCCNGKVRSAGGYIWRFAS